MRLLKHKRFIKSYQFLDAKIQAKVDQTIMAFVIQPLDPNLNNHKLKWKYQWFSSLNVTWDYRIIFVELSDGSYELVELVDVGTHSQFIDRGDTILMIEHDKSLLQFADDVIRLKDGAVVKK